MQPDDGQHRDQRVAQRMVGQGAPPAQPLGARRADIVLAEHLEHGRAHHPRQNRGLWQRQRHRRQGQRLQARPDALVPAGKPAGRKPAKVDRENHHKDHREPEIRDGDAELGKPHDAPVTRPATAAGGIKPDRNGDQRRQQQRHQRQRQRHGEPRRDQLGHRRAIGI